MKRLVLRLFMRRCLAPQVTLTTPGIVRMFLVIIGSAVTGAATSQAHAEEEALFARDIQPLLAKRCLVCHGPDLAEAGLRLDTPEAAYAETDSGTRAIVPGDAEASELIYRVTCDDDSMRMPPDDDPLTEEEIARLRQWIRDGAKYEMHWAYQPVRESPLPPVKSTAWVRNPIDQFVLARLEAKDLSPSPTADRATLIKRLHYDLIGLPPAPSTVDAFVEDPDPAAYEQLVDRLLASEHFGERWGRHWLDKARYADSDGYEKDRPRPNAWRYRDWVIDAINTDLPYDQFTIEQLAGDLLTNPSPNQQLATAFHRQTLTNTEGGTDKEEFRVEATFDRTETTAAVWMGLTMTCARCHSHKYDRISQDEYYQLFAFFNNADEAESQIARSDEALAKYEREKEAHDQRVAKLTAQYQSAKESLRPQIQAWLSEIDTQRQTAERSTIDFQPAKPLEVMTSTGSKLVVQEDGSLLARGPSPDRDKYTLLFGAPERPLSGIRIDVLASDEANAPGPGRTAHGNFVVSELRLHVGDDRTLKDYKTVALVGAEADFAQEGFPAQNALSTAERSGWAISPRMGQDHQITCYMAKPLALGDNQFVQVVLDQQYGGKHTIGRFRVSWMSGFDPLRALPGPVADAVGKVPAERSAADQQVIADYVAGQDPETAELALRLEKLKEQSPKSPMMSVRVMKPAERLTRVLHRGDFLQPGNEVRGDILATIEETHPLTSRHPNQPPDRLDLARWLIHEDHPLTPRVTVNQVWSHLFGRGLVPTINDFGVRGDQPTHPKLLDWLAWQFPRDMGWSRKTLIKTIVMSATYRQSSRHRLELREIDPTNRLLARQNRLRVEAEIVRDLHLAVGGLLSRRMGGPSVYPPLPPGITELSYANNFQWKTSEEDNRYRRGMYTFFKRTSPHPTLISFDCPDSNTTRLQRESSNTPLQALATLNNEVYTEAAQAMARRVISEAGPGDAERLEYALRLCVVRAPRAEEVEAFRHLLNESRQYFQQHSAEAEQLARRHAAAGIAPAENAAWVATVRVVMNLDEFIVRD